MIEIYLIIFSLMIIISLIIYCFVLRYSDYKLKKLIRSIKEYLDKEKELKNEI